MLRTHELVKLASRYRDQQVLTVYLHTTVDNPADRHIWQVELEHALEPIRKRLTHASHDDRVALHAAIARLREWLVAERGTLRAAGVVAVVSEDEVLFATATQTVVPNLASWGRGIYLAPLLGTASLGMESAVLVVDARHAHLYRFTPPRQLELVESTAASARADGERRMGGPPAGGFHAGTRGGTAADDAARLQVTERDRLFAVAVDHAAALAHANGWIVIGGTTRSVAAARALVPEKLHDRVITLEHLDINASEHQVAAAAAAAIDERETQRDQEVVRAIMEEHGARGRGVAGLSATRAMLEREGVADLILSEHFVEEKPDLADELLSRALGQGATVRQVHGVAADEIDVRAEGVVARLRYAPMAGPPAETVG